MRISRILGVGVVTLALCSPMLAAQQRVVLTGGTLIDGTGARPLRESRAVIEDGRFTCVSGADGCETRTGDRVISTVGQWVLPGLIDAHVHLPLVADPAGAARAQRLRFALGITTVRDAASGVIEALLEERARAEDAARPVPRIVPVARALPEYAEEWGIRPGAPLVEHLVSLGAEGIKIKDPFESGIWMEEIRAANRLGVPVFGHYWDGPPPVVYAYEAIDAGIGGLSHLMGVAALAQRRDADLSPPSGVRTFSPEFWKWRNDLWLTTEPAALSSLITMMVEADVWLEPLLASEYYWLIPVPQPPELTFVARIPEPLLDLLRRRGARADLGGPAYPEPYARMSAFVRDFAAAGGLIVAGSDGAGIRGVPGFDLHEEIRLLRESGLGPAASLVAATGDAAIALGRDDIGVIEAGRLADALIYDEDPLRTPGGLRAIRTVIKGGEMHSAAILLDATRTDFEKRGAALWSYRALAVLGLVLVPLGVTFSLKQRRRRLEGSTG